MLQKYLEGLYLKKDQSNSTPFPSILESIEIVVRNPSKRIRIKEEEDRFLQMLPDKLLLPKLYSFSSIN